MPKLLQINVCANWGSTGKIVEQIGEKAMDDGWESYVYYGDYANPSKSHLIKSIGRFPFMYEHYLECNCLDREGLASRIPTLNLVRLIKRINPDIIHLHNIHDHWINYPILFRYLAKSAIPVIWTFHDMWAITGHCYINYGDCSRWKTKCEDCPKKNKFGPDRSVRNFLLKEKYFKTLKNLSIVVVSDWLRDIIKQSFLGENDITVIPNGVDVSIFRPITVENNNPYKIGLESKIILALATTWSKLKGLDDYIKLSSLLPNGYRIVLVGLTEEQISYLPSSIIGIKRISNPLDLAYLYNMASVVTSLSYSETFGLSVVEGMACGTPAVIYDNSGQSALVSDDTGIKVETGNVEAVRDAILAITDKDKSIYCTQCRNRAIALFNKETQFSQYISLYNRILAR